MNLDKVKDEARVIGIDDAPFDKFDPVNKQVKIIGTVYRGGNYMDGVVSTEVEKDGDDATVKLIQMINNCKFKPQLQAIFLDGIAVAGFNVINAKTLSEKTGLPVIVIVREKPNLESFCQALRNLDMERKISLVKQMPEPVKVNNVYAQLVNIGREEAEEFINVCSPNSDIPEAIRVAHIIASGIVDGESRGGA